LINELTKLADRAGVIALELKSDFGSEGTLREVLSIWERAMFQCGNRQFRLIATIISFVAASCSPAFAQVDYPKQRVSILIGFSAGGFADTVARIVGARLGERLGQSFVTQNLEGGGGIRAARQATVARPDGYTILVTTTSLAINETLVPNRGYNADQFEAVAIPVSAPESISANNNASIISIADLVKAAKAGKVHLGTPGLGSGSHIASQYFFKNLAKADVNHIPFAGGNPAMLGLMAGDINVLASTATSSTLRHMTAGDVTPIAVAGRKRSSIIPNVPTFSESGYAGFEASSWVGFFVPAGTPTAIVEKLNQEINAVMQEDETQKRIALLGLETFIRSRPDTAAFFTEEIANWSRMVVAAGIVQ
jgi:tripartite-type tricarboxylate transporter receptor subunit TctC